MSEQDVCSDERVLEILWNQEELTHNELDSLLYRLFHAGDNPDSDSLQRYTHLTWYDYDRKMSKVLRFIYKFCPNLDFYDCKEITNQDIRDLVGVLPNSVLADFLEQIDDYYYITINYEEDSIYECDYLLDISEDTILKEIINDKDILSQEDINSIVEFISDLDLFDIELYKLYKEV